MTEIDNFNTDLKFYSSKAVAGATFIGGPLAGGYLIAKNYKALGQYNKQKIAIYLGILSTILIIGGIFLIPENIINKIPNQIIPIIYTAAMYGIVEWKQGQILNKHASSNQPFYSGWQAAGVGLVSLVILCAIIFGYTYFAPHEQINEKYDSEIVQFTQNETKALEFYDNLQVDSREDLINQLVEESIPLWEENVEIITRLSAMPDLQSEFILQNEALLAYSKLRVEEFKLFLRGVVEETNQYEAEITRIHSEIDLELSKMK